MSLSQEDALKLHGSLTGRIETPTLENAVSEAISKAFRTLIETKYLYQKIEIDLTAMDSALKAVVEAAKRRSMVPLAGGRGMAVFKGPPELTEARLKGFREEISRRPWEVETHHKGDDDMTISVNQHSRGSVPIGTPIEGMLIGFYLPPASFFCSSSKCKATTTFSALCSSKKFRFGSPQPRDTTHGREEIILADYRCNDCRSLIYNILVRRIGLKLHLCGFSPRRTMLPTRNVPETLQPILNDAEQAVAEGDVYGALYHLRTMIEHYLRGRLNMPAQTKIRGEDLIDQYHATLNPHINGALPSLSSAWQNLSENIHARSGDDAEFAKQRDAICKHIEGIATLGDAALAVA